MFTAAFWKATAERAIKTFAQALVATLTASATGLLDTDWVGALSTSAMATVLSVLASVASSGLGNAGPSLANEVTAPPAPAIKDERGEAYLGLIVGVLLVVILVVVLLRVV